MNKNKKEIKEMAIRLQRAIKKAKSKKSIDPSVLAIIKRIEKRQKVVDKSIVD